MKKEEMNQTAENQTNTLSNVAVGIAVIIVFCSDTLCTQAPQKQSDVTHVL